MINNWPRLALLGALVAAACSRSPGVPPGYQGIVELDERVLAFEVPGRVVEVSVRPGDLVGDGQVIAKLDDELERLARDARAEEASGARADLELLAAGARRQDVAALRADVSAIAATADLAAKTAERVRELHASGAVARAELDRAEAELGRVTEQKRAMVERLSAVNAGARPEELARARSRVAAARAALDLEETRLARHELRARGGGLVLDVTVEPGELAAVGTVAATIADVTHPLVNVFVPVAELGGLRVGTKAEVRVDAASALVPGAIEYVSPTTEFTPRFIFSERERPHLVVRVRVRVADPKQDLHAGVPAFVTFQR